MLITWAAVDSSFIYDVLRDGTSIATGIAYGTTTYIDITGSNNVAYIYAVRYYNSCAQTYTTPGAAAADSIDTTPCPDICNTLLIIKSGINAIISWSAISCADFENYRVYGSYYYSNPFPMVWDILGDPTTTSLNDPLSSDYVAYKAFSVDACGNLSTN